MLYAQAQVPEYQFRLRWTPGAIVFWDNRSTQHYAANDYYPERRRMERTAVIGDVPVLILPRAKAPSRGMSSFKASVRSRLRAPSIPSRGASRSPPDRSPAAG